jgi:hypothetical protein
MTENLPAAYYLSDRYVANPDEPRYLLPIGGKLVNRDGYLALVGREPPAEPSRRPNAWKQP